MDLPARAIREQIAACLDLIVQQQRFSDGSRKISAISEVVGMGADGHVQLRPIFSFVRTPAAGIDTVEGEFRPSGYLPSYLAEFVANGLVGSGEAYL